jgi:RNA polymerase sigma factor (sigma-70 family)
MPVMMTTAMSAVANNDADLVVACLSGDRDAFGHIVSRYQSLICSLAYSATGSLGQSEDLAQETFITAWKHLRHLRERNKLRAWLCGIARNRINSSLRRDGREPVNSATPLEEIHDSASAEPLPHDHTISKEEEAILWRSLERIPEIYREPLVLFYREHQSVEAVALSLELSEDAVKQRLSRGRKLLAEEVAAFVEGALARTNPGKAFTLTVVAALSGITISAQAATIGLAAAKGGAVAKSVGATGLLATLSSPLLVIFGNYLGYRMSMDEAQTDNERQYLKLFYRRILIVTFTLTTLFAAILLWVRPPKFSNLTVAGIVFMSSITFYLLAVLANIFITSAGRRRYYSQILAEEHGGVLPKPAFEYRSSATILGLPLVHIRIGDRFDVLQKPVKGWFAMGNYAIGGLLAFGGIACAPIGIGLCGIGLLPFAGVAIGLVPLGGIALGGWAYGGLAIGWQSMGCFAIALNMAAGNIAIAHDYALGNFASAAQINAAVNIQAVAPGWYLRGGEFLQRHSLWLNFIWIAPLFVQWRIVLNQKRKAASSATRN